MFIIMVPILCTIVKMQNRVNRETKITQETKKKTTENGTYLG